MPVSLVDQIGDGVWGLFHGQIVLKAGETTPPG